MSFSDISLSDVAGGIVGYNNLKAMYDISNNRYGFNTLGKPSNLIRYKQYFTEGFHLAAKYYVINQLYNAATKGTLYDLLGHVTSGPGKYIWTAVRDNVMPIAAASSAGVIFVAYLSPRIADMVNQAGQISSNTSMSLVMKRAKVAGREAYNITATAYPVISAYSSMGATGALIATAPIHLMEMQNQKDFVRSDDWKPYYTAFYSGGIFLATYLYGKATGQKTLEDVIANKMYNIAAKTWMVLST